MFSPFTFSLTISLYLKLFYFGDVSGERVINYVLKLPSLPGVRKNFKPKFQNTYRNHKLKFYLSPDTF